MVKFYTMQNVFYLPVRSRWSFIQQHSKQGDIAIKIDSALTDLEKSNASLKGALPDNDFSRLGMDGSKLSALIDAINNIDTVEDKEEDTVDLLTSFVDSLTQRSKVNVIDSGILTKLHDTLLPKLISGELRIPDAEPLVI